MRLTEGGDGTAGSSLCGAASGTPPEGAKHPAYPASGSNRNFRGSNDSNYNNLRGSNAGSDDRVNVGSRLQKPCANEGGPRASSGGPGAAAGRRVSAVGGVRRRSALGAVMEAAGDRAVDSQEQVCAAAKICMVGGI